MDPTYHSKPDISEYFQLNTEVKLYYELRGNGMEKVVLIMGAFAPLRHYDQLADQIIKDGNFQVLTFDNRGIGKSTTPILKQTSQMLGQDTYHLINHVWGPESKVHVYGASMGGCIAQHLAETLALEKRLKSLYLAVTTCGNFIRIPFGTGFYKMIIPMMIKSDSREMIRSILPSCFDKEYLKQEISEQSIGKLWEERWTQEYTEWFSFHNLEACAAQSTVFSLHYMKDSKLDTIRESGAPIMVHVATNDQLMKPSDQFKLASKMGGKTVVFEGGHMGSIQDAKKFTEGLMEHLHSAT